jgi:hypothetical protein
MARSIGSRSTAGNLFYSIVALAISLAGCDGMPDPPPSSTAGQNAANDPDVFRPASKTPSPPPPAPPNPIPTKSAGKKTAVPNDPDVFVPDSSPKTKKNIKTLSPKSSTLTNPSSAKDNSLPDPDAFSSNATVSSVKNTSAARSNENKVSSQSLAERIKRYQNQQTDAAEQVKLEKEFIAESREAILDLSGLEVRAAKADIGKQTEDLLWNKPFADYLDIQLQSLRTLSQRPTTVNLACLIPNEALRVDLRRTLSRHWSEGPKAIRPASNSDAFFTEPGFILVLKSLIRENRAQTAKSASLNKSRVKSPDEMRKSSLESEWNGLLEELARDYCRRCHAASLARSAAALAAKTEVPKDYRQAETPIPLPPGCETLAAHRFAWPDKKDSTSNVIIEPGLALEYQRFEKRTKIDKPLLYYRRHLTSCIEHKLPDGVWMDCFVDRKGETRTRSLDVLVTMPKSAASATSDEEVELTIEILCVEISKAKI